MRKLIFLLLLLLIATPVFAQQQEARMSLGVVGGGVPAAGCTASYGSELFITANATDDGGGNEADATTGFTATAAIDSVTTAPQAGTYHLTLVADAASEQVYRTITEATAENLYRLSIYARHNGTASANGEWRCYMGNSSTSVNQYVTPLMLKTDITYAQSIKYFYFGANQDNIVCIERNAANDGGIYLDNFSLKAATLCYGDQLFVDGNAASLSNEANSVGSFTNTGGTLASSATSPADGTYCLTFTSDTTADARFYIDLSGILTVGKKYLLSYKHKYVSGDGFYCGLFGATTIAQNTDAAEWLSGTSADPSTTWKTVGFSFVYATASHRYFGCHEGGGTNNAAFNIDSILIKEITGE